MPGVTRAVADNQRIDVGEPATVLSVPGHTRGALAFHFAGHLFTGDTLFLAGCGRLFEGTAEQMHASLTRLAALPDETRVYCGHEYTEKNLTFAATVDPTNTDLSARLEAVRALRAGGGATVPGSLGEEKRTNPFLRCGDPVLQELAGRTARSGGLGCCRGLKQGHFRLALLPIILGRSTSGVITGCYDHGLLANCSVNAREPVK